MRYNIKRWHENKDNPISAEIGDCERLEVVKQVIKAIDNGQNFEAKVAGPEKEDDL